MAYFQFSPHPKTKFLKSYCLLSTYVLCFSYWVGNCIHFLVRDLKLENHLKVCENRLPPLLFLSQEVWGKACELAFLRRFPHIRMPLLLLWEPHCWKSLMRKSCKTAGPTKAQRAGVSFSRSRNVKEAGAEFKVFPVPLTFHCAYRLVPGQGGKVG